MVINFCIFLILFIWAFLTLSYAYILRYHIRVKKTWRKLQEVFRSKFVLYSEILDVATLTYSADSEIIRELYDRVNKCFNAEAPEEHSRADKKAKNTIIKMEKLMVKYPFLYEAEKYADMKNSLIILEEKTEFSRQFYNEEITSYNERVFRLPVRIVSSIFNFRKKNAL